MFRLTIWRIILSYMASPKFMTQLESSSRFSLRYLLGLLPRFRGNGLKSHSSGEDIALPTGDSFWSGSTLRTLGEMDVPVATGMPIQTAGAPLMESSVQLLPLLARAWLGFRLSSGVIYSSAV